MSSLNPTGLTEKQELPRLPLFSWPVWTILLLSLCLTFFGWRLAVQSETEAGKAQFQHSIEEVTRDLYTRLGAYEQVLTGGVALFTAMGDVSRSQWRDYVASQEIDRRFPGIQGVGYAALIPAEQIGLFSQNVRENGIDGFPVNPAGSREAYSSILYLEPLDWRNQRALGYDMFSEPVRRAAMERARDTGRAALSGKVRLVQETDQDVQAGFLIYLPLYRVGAPLQTVEQRRDALKGWIYAPFRMDDLMNGLLEGETALLRFDITDAAVDAGDGLMYSSSTATYPSHYSDSIEEQIFGHP